MPLCNNNNNLQYMITARRMFHFKLQLVSYNSPFFIYYLHLLRIILRIRKVLKNEENKDNKGAAYFAHQVGNKVKSYV